MVKIAKTLMAVLPFDVVELGAFEDLAEGYEAKGTLEISNQYFVKQVPFTVERYDNAWRICSTFGDGEYELWAFDGKTTRSYYHWPAAPGQTSAVSVGYVFSGELPPINATPLTSYLWYALASDSYFKHASTGPHPTPWNPQGTLTQSVFVASFTVSDGELKLPTLTE